MEKYEKKYKEVLEKAKALYKASEPMSGCNVIIETLFPELKESEDEKVRKELIKHLKELSDWKEDEVIPVKNPSYYRQWASWLERQGEHANFLSKIQVGDKVTRNENGVLVNLSQLERVAKPRKKQGDHAIYNVPAREVILAIWNLGNEWKELTNGCISTEYGTQLDYIQKHWCESEYYLREKQDEKKPADKEEPKFHEGEWITNGDYTWKIVEVGLWITLQSQDGNVVDDTISYVDEQFHSFTIEDAKDGDVLACKDELILFKSYDNKNLCYYCWYNGQTNNFFPKDTHTSRPRLDIIVPATKEQRDLLFQKMKEAGYEWDAEKKELKKFHIIDEGKSEMDYCFTKMMGGEKVSSAWSEEDERIMNGLIDSLTRISLNTRTDSTSPNYTFYKEIDWLKSLRPQSQWKPSDEQMIALRDVISGCSYDIEPLVELETKLKEL